MTNPSPSTMSPEPIRSDHGQAKGLCVPWPQFRDGHSVFRANRLSVLAKLGDASRARRDAARGGSMVRANITNSLCGGCRGAEVRDLWIPLSFRPQTAQEPFSCFRASPGCDKFGDDVPPE